MATREATAIMRDQALAKLKAAAGTISAATGIDAPQLLDFDRDSDYLHAAQLEGIAAWAERLTDVFAVIEVSEAQQDEAREAHYRAMTKAELKAEAVVRGIDLSGMKTKDEYVTAFLAADAEGEG